MNFDWTEQQLESKKSIGALFDKDALDELDKLESADVPEIKSTILKYMKLLAPSGYLKAAQGPEGAGESLALTAAQEEVSQASSPLFLAVEATVRLFGGLVAGFGSDDLKQEILNRLAEGEILAGVGISEAEGQQTTAVERGDAYALNGAKAFVTNATIADELAIFGTVDDKHAFFVIQSEAEGVNIGPKLETLGYRGLAVSSVELVNVEVPKSRVLGPFDDSAALDYIRMVEAMVLTQASIGLSRRLLNTATAYAKEYKRGGRQIIKYQEIGFKLAELLTLVQTAEWMGRRAAWLVEKGDSEAATVANCAKVFSAESAEFVASAAMQIFAGAGYISGNIVERGYRDAKYASLAGLSNEVSRMTIADDILKRYQI